MERMEQDFTSDLHQMADEMTLSDPQLSYVLITCAPGRAGIDLNVRMTSRGDRVLISYLLEGGAEKLLSEMEAEADLDIR